MFSYFFYVGGMALVGLVASGMLCLAYRSAPLRFQNKSCTTVLVTACLAIVIGLPYAGYWNTIRAKDVTKRNNEFAMIETEIMKMNFDFKCSFNGYRTGEDASSDNSFPCIQRENIRILSTLYRTGLSYFLVEKGDIPVRWRGMVEFPIPFSFPQDKNLLSPESVKRAFLASNAVARNIPASRGR